MLRCSSEVRSVNYLTVGREKDGARIRIGPASCQLIAQCHLGTRRCRREGASGPSNQHSPHRTVTQQSTLFATDYPPTVCPSLSRRVWQ